MLNCLHLHLIGKRLLAGEYMLPLQVGVHHGDNRLVVGHVPDDDRHGGQTQRSASSQTPVAGHQLITLALAPCQSRGQHAGFPDALCQSIHFFALLYLKRMIGKLRYLLQGDFLHLGLADLRPARVVHKKLVIGLLKAQIKRLMVHRA